MKRWLWLILVLIAIGVTYSVHRAREVKAQRQREATYREKLEAYSDVLKPGMTRAQVEEYLKAKGLQFSRTCCVAERVGALDDMVRIGEENPAWYCSELNVYLGFEFNAHRKHPIWDPKVDELDTLKSVGIYRWQESCL
jgi:hypothetical protein